MTKGQDNISLTRQKEQTGRERASYVICNIIKKDVNTTRYVHLPCKRKWQLDPGWAIPNTFTTPPDVCVCVCVCVCDALQIAAS